jgi:hypothetical protein
MSIEHHPAMIGLTIQKPIDASKPINVSLGVDIDHVGRVDVDLDEHQFAHLLGATQLQVQVEWRPERGKSFAPGPRDLLARVRDSLPEGHPDRIGLTRAIEVLRLEEARPGTFAGGA